MDCRSRIKPNFAVGFRGIKIGRSHHQRASRLGHISKKKKNALKTIFLQSHNNIARP